MGKYVYPFKDKKRYYNTNAFQKILHDPNRKSNRIWADEGSKFYNRSKISWLEKNAIEMYSRHNKGKSVIVQRFLEPWKTNL